ncbi:nuclear transport factor 2 family protein [Actinomycetospora soli]|uniref:nuclear transport factor 2 family protein n=1 Tax=Actinomycetospora soli TaxID=2893887 RepID=UPI001E4856AE|nr:hypothetical protein [Actinomycetospora soli]MCD2187264.1 hypothetical protein [Actinomycetospora soli]
MTADSRDVVRRYLDAVGALDLPALATTFADDVVMDLPYAPPGFPRRVEGKADVTDPSAVIAHDASDARILATDRVYRNHDVSRFRVEDGAITWFAEYFDPLVLVEALGGRVVAPGEEVPA